MGNNKLHFRQHCRSGNNYFTKSVATSDWVVCVLSMSVVAIKIFLI